LGDLNGGEVYGENGFLPVGRAVCSKFKEIIRAICTNGMFGKWRGEEALFLSVFGSPKQSVCRP
jgi:hypothetical protein